MRRELRKRRRDGRHAGGDGDRHRQHVVHQQRGRGHQAGDRTQVRPRDDVGAAAARIGVDRLLVGDRDDRQQPGDGERDRNRQVKRGRAGQDQDEQDLFRRVGDRRERVGRKHGERDPLAQALVVRLGERHRRADEGPLEERESHARLDRERMNSI